MKFSIIITAHKDRGYIDECILSCKDSALYSFIKNSEFSFEIILASDGNPELKKYAEKHNIIFSLSMPKKNMASSFNEAVKIATGDYLKIFSDDDIMNPEGFYQLCENAYLTNPDLVISNYSSFSESIDKLTNVITPISEYDNDFVKLVLNKKIGCGTTLIKKDSFVKVGGFDGNFNIAEGNILWFKFIKNNINKINYINTVSAYYRLHTDQKSRGLSDENKEKRNSEFSRLLKTYSGYTKVKITQCHVAKCVRFFKDNFLKKYNLTEYKDPDSPAVFYGMYDSNELNVIEKHNSHAVVMWCGSDSVRLENIKKCDKKNITNIIQSKFEEDDFKKAGVSNYKFIPITVADHEKLQLKAVPLGDKIYAYRSQDKILQFAGSDDFFGTKLINQLIEIFGKERFIFTNGLAYTHEQLYKEIYPKCFVGLRLYAHDGLSETVIEMGIMGRKMIYNGIEPNAINYNNIDDIVNAIKEEEKNIGKTYHDLSKKVYNYICKTDDFLYVDKVNKINNYQPESKKTNRIAIITAIYGRYDLSDKVLSYYNELRKQLYPEIELVNIVAGSEGEISRGIAERNNWIYTEQPNYPLNLKHNSALQIAKDYNPDYVLAIGSDDIVSRGMFEKIYSQTNSLSIGFLDCYFYSTEKNELAYWPGYKNERKDETCGAGRFFSKSALDKLNWNLWDINEPISCSLDRQSQSIIKKNNIPVLPFRMKDIREFIIDIKTNHNICSYESIYPECEILGNDEMSNVMLNTIESIKNNLPVYIPDFNDEKSKKEIKIPRIRKTDSLKIIWRILSICDAEIAVNCLNSQTDNKFDCLFVTNNKEVNDYLLEKKFDCIYSDLSHLNDLKPTEIDGDIKNPYPINDLYNIGLDNSNGKKYWLLDSGINIKNDSVENINEYTNNKNVLFKMTYNGNIHESVCGFIFLDKTDIRFLPYQYTGVFVYHKLFNQPHEKINVEIAFL